MTSPAAPSGVTLAACLAWHFYELNSQMRFLTPGAETPLGAAGDVIYDALNRLSLIEPAPAGSDADFLRQLAERTDTFKIILTARSRGSIPTSLWASSYILFLQSL